jgi:hypothetical protein
MDRLFEKLAQWRSASCLSLLLLVFLAAPVRGEDPCTIGLAPAATLLLP